MRVRRFYTLNNPASLILYSLLAHNCVSCCPLLSPLPPLLHIKFDMPHPLVMGFTALSFLGNYVKLH